jgi:hypothetical protein
MPCQTTRTASHWRSGFKSEPGRKTVRGTVFPANARVGQQGTLTRIRAPRGSRPRAPRDTRDTRACIFGAVCPERGATAALVMPHADTQAMTAHLAEISCTVADGAHAVLVRDGAGWHGSKALPVPDNITLRPLPPCALQLNPIENVRACLRANRLAISVFETCEDIVARCCQAWTFFAEDAATVRSITNRDYAKTVST